MSAWHFAHEPAAADSALYAVISYSELTGRGPDFRVRYRKTPSPQRLYQHMRTDFRFADDAEGTYTWMIWPEFESDSGQPCDGEAPIADVGTATMWVLNESEEYRALLRQWLRVGVSGTLVAGPIEVARAEVVELLGKEFADERSV